MKYLTLEYFLLLTLTSQNTIISLGKIIYLNDFVFLPWNFDNQYYQCVGYSVVFCFSAKCRNLVMNCSLNAYVFMHYLHAELEIANSVQNCPNSDISA